MGLATQTNFTRAGGGGALKVNTLTFTIHASESSWHPELSGPLRPNRAVLPLPRPCPPKTVSFRRPWSLGNSNLVDHSSYGVAIFQMNSQTLLYHEIVIGLKTEQNAQNERRTETEWSRPSIATVLSTNKPSRPSVERASKGTRHVHEPLRCPKTERQTRLNEMSWSRYLSDVWICWQKVSLPALPTQEMPTVESYLKQCIYQAVLENQPPHKLINLIFQ